MPHSFYAQITKSVSILALLALSSCSPAPAKTPIDSEKPPFLSTLKPSLSLLPNTAWTLLAPNLSAARVAPAGPVEVDLTSSGLTLRLNTAPLESGLFTLTLERLGERAVRFTLFVAGVNAPQMEELRSRLNAVRSTGYTCPDRAYPAVPPLVPEASLARAALAHALDMRAQNYFSHLSPSGVTPFERAVQGGYAAPTVIGEDLARGPQTTAAALQAWLLSPEHCQSVLSGEYREVGLAVVDAPGHPALWVALLGNR